MPRMENSGGDSLARGASRYTFRPAGEKLTREKWNKIWRGKAKPVKKGVYLFDCPVHGKYESDREFFISGGYPLMNEYATGVCPLADCGEKSTFAGFQPVEIAEPVAA